LTGCFPLSIQATKSCIILRGIRVADPENSAQVVVLGIEDGPASRAGAHWGRHHSVCDWNHYSVRKKPGSMTLKIGRDDTTKEFTFKLAGGSSSPAGPPARTSSGRTRSARPAGALFAPLQIAVEICLRQLTVPGDRVGAKARGYCPVVTSRRSVRRILFQSYS
jgi:hypothetical protein